MVRKKRGRNQKEIPRKNWAKEGKSTQEQVSIEFLSIPNLKKRATLQSKTIKTLRTSVEEELLEDKWKKKMNITSKRTMKMIGYF